MKKVKVLEVGFTSLESKVNSVTENLDVDNIQFFHNGPQSGFWTVIITYNVEDEN